jgi:ankyrin repeat protein
MKVFKLVFVLTAGVALVESGLSQPKDAFWYEPLSNKMWRGLKADKFFDSQIQIDLANAAAKGDTNQLHALVKHGADVNCLGREGMRPLFWAMVKHSSGGFSFLLQHGADPNAAVADTEPRGQTVISLAASLGDSNFLREALLRGGNPNLVGGQSRRTPIFTAAFYQRTDNVSILLKHGADINWQSAGGHTALGAAVDGCSYEMALFLYHAGASPLVTNKLNYCAIDSIGRFGDRGIMSRADKAAYRQLVEEFQAAGLLKAARK